MPEPKPRPIRLYFELYTRAAFHFLDTARLFLPVDEDPDSIRNLPGYPEYDMWHPYQYAYEYSICLRTEFYRLFDWDDGEAELEALGDEYYDDFMTARDWFENLFETLTERWNWASLFRRYPVCFPDSLTELIALLRRSERHLELFPEVEELAIQAAGEESEADSPTWIISGWLLNMQREIRWDLHRPSPTRGELRALDEIDRLFSSGRDDRPAASIRLNRPDLGPTTSGALERQRVRRFKRGHLDEMALSIAVMHPEYTNLQVAQHLGCHVKTLSNRGICPRFNHHRDAQKSGRDRLRGGYFDSRSGRVDQVTEDDT